MIGFKNLQTVSENARLETTSVDDELESWDQTGFMLRSDIGDHLTHSKLVILFLSFYFQNISDDFF